MWSDRVLNPGPQALESDALPTALCGLAWGMVIRCACPKDAQPGSHIFSTRAAETCCRILFLYWAVQLI